MRLRVNHDQAHTHVENRGLTTRSIVACGNGRMHPRDGRCQALAYGFCDGECNEDRV